MGKCQKGQMVIISLIFLTVVLILTGSLFGRTASFLRFGGNSLRNEQANALAEAGINYALWQLNKTAGAFNNGIGETALGATGTFEVQIVPKTEILKGIIATGYVPDKTNYRSKRIIKTDALVSSETVSFRYAIQVGTGGVNMENSAIIQGVGGTSATVYSNATDAQTSPNKSIQGSGSSRIVGDAYAVGTISTPDPTVTGNKFETQTASVMPDISAQVADWQNTVDACGVSCTVDCTVTPSLCSISSGTVNIGPKKYVGGDLTLSGTATVNVQGPIWISGGNFAMDNSAELKLDTSLFGSTGTGLLVSGTVSTNQSSVISPTTASPPGYIIVVSQSTANPAVLIRNSGQNAIFYALSGTAQMENSAHVSAMVANGLKMQNSAVLDYDSGLASAQFSSGPGGSWQVKKGTYRYTGWP